jgi:hypothetical protein
VKLDGRRCSTAGKSGGGFSSNHLLAKEAAGAWQAWQQRGGAHGRSSGDGVWRSMLAHREEEQSRGMDKEQSMRVRQRGEKEEALGPTRALYSHVRRWTPVKLR